MSVYFLPPPNEVQGEFVVTITNWYMRTTIEQYVGRMKLDAAGLVWFSRENSKLWKRVLVTPEIGLTSGHGLEFILDEPWWSLRPSLIFLADHTNDGYEWSCNIPHGKNVRTKTKPGLNKIGNVAPSCFRDRLTWMWANIQSS